MCGYNGYGEVSGGGGVKLKNIKTIIFILLFILSIIQNTSAKGDEYDIKPDILAHKSYLYIFDTKEEDSLTKIIDRTGRYSIKALISPKTTKVKEKYIYPLDLNIPKSTTSIKVNTVRDGISVSIKPGSESKKVVFPPIKSLDINTYIYPYFYLNYNSPAKIDISLYFYVDVNNDKEIDFLAYYGNKPDESISGGLKSYPMSYYMKHDDKGREKSISTNLYNELRIHRPDRVSFILRKFLMVIKGSNLGKELIIKDVGLYNEESLDKSVILQEYNREKQNKEGDLYSFMEEKGKLAALLNSPLFELNNKKYYLNQLKRNTINEILREKSEVDFSTLELKKGEEVKLNSFENEYVNLETLFLSENISQKREEPVIEFKRVNPTRYVVDVKASDSFWISLCENYHTGWRAYVAKDIDVSLGTEKSALLFALNSKGKLIRLSEHRRVNAYANGWFVPVKELFKKEAPYNFKIIMEFYPQRLYESGLIISSIFFIIMLIWVIIHFVKKGIRKRK